MRNTIKSIAYSYCKSSVKWSIDYVVLVIEEADNRYRKK